MRKDIHGWGATASSLLSEIARPLLLVLSVPNALTPVENSGDDLGLPWHRVSGASNKKNHS